MTEAEYETLEAYESESEFAERRPFPKPSAKPSFQRRLPPSFVTQVQLEAALTRVDGKIKTVSDGVSTLNTRVSSLSSTLKKEADERKKDVEGQKRDLNQKVQLLALLPLLIRPPTYTIGAGAITAAPNPTAVVLQADAGNAMNALLPLLLVSGIGGSGGFGLGGGDSGSDSSLLFLALILAFGNR
jgi:hypothetical protein